MSGDRATDDNGVSGPAPVAANATGTDDPALRGWWREHLADYYGRAMMLAFTPPAAPRPTRYEIERGAGLQPRAETAAVYMEGLDGRLWCLWSAS